MSSYNLFWNLESSCTKCLCLLLMGLGWVCLSAGDHTLMVCAMHQAHQQFDQDTAALATEASACQPLPKKSTSKKIYCFAKMQQDHLAHRGPIVQSTKFSLHVFIVALFVSLAVVNESAIPCLLSPNLQLIALTLYASAAFYFIVLFV
jgi:hypothetical protein